MLRMKTFDQFILFSKSFIASFFLSYQHLFYHNLLQLCQLAYFQKNVCLLLLLFFYSIEMVIIISRFFIIFYPQTHCFSKKNQGFESFLIFSQFLYSFSFSYLIVRVDFVDTSHTKKKRNFLQFRFNELLLLKILHLYSFVMQTSLAFK